MAGGAEEVVVIGAGLAGLCCALRLREGGLRPRVLEAADAVGGRIRTDEVDGFRLDRGFQVLPTAYPEARRMLDYPALRLGAFFPGALVRADGRFQRVADPFRRPLAAVGSLFNRIGSPRDKLRIARTRARVRAGSLGELFRRPERSTAEALREEGYTPAMVERFWRPFLGGVYLEQELRTTSRMWEFVVRIFSEDDVCLPAGGISAIPEQLAARLPADTVRLRQRVERVTAAAVTLASGEEVRARAVVVAVDGPEAARLCPEIADPGSRAAASLYFAAPEPPLPGPVLVLNGEGRGPVSNLCIPSNIAGDYAPAGQSLVSCSVAGEVARLPETELTAAVIAQLAEWFGPSVRDWRHLRSYRIRHALPEAPQLSLEPPERSTRLASGVYVCGDHRDNASIHGAMTSGRRVAESLLVDL